MKDTTTIDIDLEVFKFIVQHSNFIDEPANDVLKRLLKLNPNFSLENTKSNKLMDGGLTVKEIFLKNGLQLRKHFKGKVF